jgi:hypothetical protein
MAMGFRHAGVAFASLLIVGAIIGLILYQSFQQRSTTKTAEAVQLRSPTRAQHRRKPSPNRSIAFAG